MGGCEQADPEQTVLNPVSWTRLAKHRWLMGAWTAFVNGLKVVSEAGLLSERKELTVGRYAGWTPASG